MLAQVLAMDPCLYVRPSVTSRCSIKTDERISRASFHLSYRSPTIEILSAWPTRVVLIGGAHWRHPVNTTKRSMHCGLVSNYVDRLLVVLERFPTLTADSAPCCNLRSYFKRASFCCRYIRTDIMRKCDVIGKTGST